MLYMYSIFLLIYLVIYCLCSNRTTINYICFCSGGGGGGGYSLDCFIDRLKDKLIYSYATILNM